MAWVKMKANLIDSAEVEMISIATGLDKFEVVGRLQYLWGWVFQYTKDGTTILDRAAVDRKVCHPGFADAMVSVHWLADGERGLVFVNWQKHNTTDSALKDKWAAKKRAQRESNQCPPNVPGDKVEQTKTKTKTKTKNKSWVDLDPSAQSQLLNATKPCDAGASPVRAVARTDGVAKKRTFSNRVLQVWEACRWRKVGRRAALRKIEEAGAILAAERFNGDKDKACAFLTERAAAYSDSPLVRTTPTQFRPHPATWFNEGRYDDDPAEWQAERSSNGTQDALPDTSFEWDPAWDQPKGGVA